MPESLDGQDAAPTDLPLATRVVRGGTVVALTSYGLVLFGFLATLVLTRILSPEDFGIVSLATFFFSLLNLRPKLGVELAFGQRRDIGPQASGTFALLNIAAGLGSLLLALIAAPILLWFHYSPAVVSVLLVLGLVGVSDSIMGVAWVQLDKALLFGRVSLVMAAAFPLSYLPAFYMAVRGWGYWALVASTATYSVLLLVGLWWSLKKALPALFAERWALSGRLAREFIGFGSLIGIATIAASLVYQFDNFLVGTFVGLAGLGFYERAYRIAQWPSLLVSSVLSRTAFYAYSQLQNDLVRLTKTATMSLWMITSLALPLALAIFVSADDLVSLLFGERWLPSALFVRFLVAYSVLRPLLDDATSLFIAVGQPRRTTLVTLAQAATIVAAATPLTLAFGATGTAVGVGITFIVGLIVTYYFVRRTLPTLSLSQAFVVPAFATVAGLAAYFALSSVVDLGLLPLIARVVVKAASAALVFAAVTLALRPRLTIERAEYVWRLLRNSAANVPS
ncbi:MAG: oligosaccharide flippase family protein [Rudaea sp.]